MSDTEQGKNDTDHGSSQIASAAMPPRSSTIMGMPTIKIPEEQPQSAHATIAAHRQCASDISEVQVYNISDQPWTLGRDPQSAFQLEDGSASYKHGVIRKDELYRMHTFTDCESSNGSAINGLYVRRAWLHAGDVIQLPGAHLTYYPAGAIRRPECERHAQEISDELRLQLISSSSGLFIVFRLRNFKELIGAFEFPIMRAICEHISLTLSQLFPFSRIEALGEGFEHVLVTAKANSKPIHDTIKQASERLSVANIDGERSISLDIDGSSSSIGSQEALPTSNIFTIGTRSAEPVSFNWIHLSDLHFGAGTEGWKMNHEQVLSAIVRDLERRKFSPRFDKMFITGDISFSGRAPQFAQAMEVLTSLAAVCDMSLSQIRVVPGNHDVQRELAGMPVTRALHSQVRQKEQLLDTYLSDERGRGILLEKLAAFCQFVNAIPGHPKGSDSLDWIEECATGDRVIRIFGLCSAWISDMFDGRSSDSSFLGNLSLSPRSLAEIGAPRTHSDATIVLTHHPEEWLMATSRRSLQEVLSASNGIHLHGHSHELEAIQQRSHGGLTRASMNAGAAHSAPEETPRHTYTWGRLIWNRDMGCWRLGWSPRVYVSTKGTMKLDSLNYEPDPEGFCWLELPSRKQNTGIGPEQDVRQPERKGTQLGISVLEMPFRDRGKDGPR